MSSSVKHFFNYFLIFLAGTAIILLVSKVQPHTTPDPGEYYYSNTLRTGYTVWTAIIFFVAGIIVGVISKLNPWLAGLSLIFIFPLVTLYEGTIYRGSHNLLPFELVIFFVFALPCVIGVYAGKFIRNKSFNKALPTKKGE